MHKLIVFDLDDTLYKEVDYLKSAFWHIASLVSTVDYSQNEIYQLMWNTYRQGGNAFETAVQTFGFHLYDVQWMLSVYRNHKPAIKLDDDTKNTLDWLKARGVTMGILSDGRKIQQMNKIDALGLKDYINEDYIIINDKYERHKPDNRSFRKLMDMFGKDNNFWYVGDNTAKDFVAPNNLGWQTICLMDDGRNIHKQRFDLPEEYLSQERIKLLSELKSVIANY